MSERRIFPMDGKETSAIFSISEIQEQYLQDLAGLSEEELNKLDPTIVPHRRILDRIALMLQLSNPSAIEMARRIADPVKVGKIDFRLIVIALGLPSESTRNDVIRKLGEAAKKALRLQDRDFIYR